MNRTTRNVLWGVGFVAGLTLLGTGAANADTTGEDGTASGTQILGIIDLPVNLGGNAISVLGDSSSSGSATNGAGSGSSNSASSSTSGADGTASGTQVNPDVKAPVNVSGNAISVLGDSKSTGSTTTGTQSTSGGSGSSTSGSDSLLGGTQVIPIVNIPINLGGNSISVLGDSQSAGSTSTTGTSTTGSSAGNETSGEDGAVSGTQVNPVITLPINLGGNAISVLGDSSTTGSTFTTGTSSTSGSSGSETSGNDGIAGGNQIIPGVSLPVAVGGNAISVLGDSSSTGSTSTGGTTTGGAGNGSTTDGTDGILGGTQVIPDVNVPVVVGGNAISVLGDSASTGGTTGTTGGTGTGGNTTAGTDGILGGTQIIPNVDLPITIGGNAISVIGDTTTTGPVTGPVDPTDPTDPTNPVDPTDPTNPVDPTSGTVTLAAADGTLAITGADPWGALLAAAMLLLGGLLFLGFGRICRTARG